MKTDSNHPFSKEGYDLMAAAFAVHDEVGGGLLEEIYQECLEMELGDRRIPFKATLACGRSFTRSWSASRRT